MDIPPKTKMGWGGPRPNSGRPRIHPALNLPARIIQRLPTGSRWHVLQIATVSVKRIQQDLTEGETRPGFPPRQAFETCHPTLAVERVRRGKKATWHEPMIKGYLLVRFDRHEDPWKTIIQVDGVLRLFTTKSLNPIPLPVGFVEQLLENTEARKVVQKVKMDVFMPGEQLRVVDGPFTSFHATCKTCDGFATTAIVHIFGRDTDVTLPRAAFERLT